MSKEDSNEKVVSFSFTPVKGVEYKTTGLTGREYMDGIFNISLILIKQLDELVKVNKDFTKQKRYDMVKEFLLDSLNISFTKKMKKKTPSIITGKE